MVNRNNRRKKMLNTMSIYAEHGSRRGLKNGIKHLSSPQIKSLTIEELGTLDILSFTWKTGDKLYKYAHEHYNDPTLWWIIGLFNLKPTDLHFKPGDVVLIPMPLEKVITLYGL
jgi:hypothetical protein